MFDAYTVANTRDRLEIMKKFVSNSVEVLFLEMADMDFEFDLEMLGIKDPVIKRRLIIPGDKTFMEFHYVLQVLFDWQSYHYFCFRPKPQDYSRIIADLKYEERFSDDEIIDDARVVKIKEVFSPRRKVLYYNYDYGDNWLVKITLLHRHSKDIGLYCESAVGKAPPEDCGGVEGFKDLKKFFATEPHEEIDDDYRPWLGLEETETWDPYDVNVSGINAELVRLNRLFFEEGPFVTRQPADYLY